MTKVTPPTPTPPAEAEAPASSSWAQNFLNRFRRFARDFLGTLLIMLALMTMLALALPELTQGVFLSPWRDFLRGWFGLGSFFVAIGLAGAGLVILRRVPVEKADLSQHPTARLRPWKRLFALELGLFAGMALLAVLNGGSLRAAESGMGGGRIGWGLAELMHGFFNLFGLQSATWTLLLSGLILLACLVYGLGFSAPLQKSLARWMELTPAPPLPAAEPIISIAPAEAAAAAGSSLSSGRRKTALPPEFRKKFRMAPTDEKSGPLPSRDERLPSLDMLINEQAARPDERHINEMAGLIEKTLAEFGIPAKVIGFRIGPTVTQFAVEPGFTLKPAANEEEATRQKVRVAQIASLRRDLSLALSAERLRIEAPVPGRPYVGIEVPNPRASTVRLRPILESDHFYKVSSPLAIALGRDVSGQPVVADLVRMPHLLIAGTTGSGKSVCIAALTACLVMNNTPSDLRLVMIDPKMVELAPFNGLPHLLCPVVTNAKKAASALSSSLNTEEAPGVSI